MTLKYDARSFRLRAMRESIRSNLAAAFPSVLDMADYTPLTANLRITHRCSSRCLSCTFASPTGYSELSTEQWKTIIAGLKESGMMQLNFTGGDIFFRRDMYDLMEYSVKLGLRVRCAINGLAVTKKSAERLMQLNLDAIAVSLDDLSPGFDRIRGVPQAARRAQQCIEMLKEANTGETQLKIAATIMKSTLTQIPGVIKFAVENGLVIEFNVIHFNHFFTDTPFSKEEYELDAAAKQELRKLLLWLADMHRRYPRIVPRLAHLEWIGQYFDDHRVPHSPCLHLMLKICVEPNGEVRSCCSDASAGNLEAQNLREILRSPENIAVVKQGLAKKCPGCSCQHNVSLDASIASRFREGLLELGLAKLA